MNAVCEQVDKTVQPQPVEAAREYVAPTVNIFESADAYVLEVEMPGVNKNGLSITVERNVLTLTGRREPVGHANVLYRESGEADYRRVFELDPSVETANAVAKIEQGVLTLTLPKAEKVKPRRITVS